MMTGTMESPTWNGPMIKDYPFVLDPFQKAAVACIVSHIVSAIAALVMHAGKHALSHI